MYKYAKSNQTIEHFCTHDYTYSCKAWYTSSMLQLMQRTTLRVAYLACCLGGGGGGGVIGAGGLHAITALAACSLSFLVVETYV